MVIGKIQLPPHTPEFDIEVQAELQSADTKAVQNELILNFYNLGMLNPVNADMALTALSEMDFKGKDELIAKIDRSRTMEVQLRKWQQAAIALAADKDKALGQQLAAVAMQDGMAPQET